MKGKKEGRLYAFKSTNNGMKIGFHEFLLKVGPLIKEITHWVHELRT